jgi:hypothetical protein
MSTMSVNELREQSGRRAVRQMLISYRRSLRDGADNNDHVARVGHTVRDFHSAVVVKRAIGCEGRHSMILFRGLRGDYDRLSSDTRVVAAQFPRFQITASFFLHP